MYFRQPLINSYLLTAERWALKLPLETLRSTLAHMADQVDAQAFGTPAGNGFGTSGGHTALPTGLPVAIANGARISSNGHSPVH